MSKEKAKGYINTAISICRYYFEGDAGAKKLAISHLKEALK